MNTEIDRKIAVILVADVVGYSKHMERDENATLKAYAECEKILETCLKKFKGSIFNTAGDSALAEFSSAVNAVECGVAFQNDIKRRNGSDKTEVKLEFRIGINMGDVVKKEGNLFGDGVNIAARLEALAQPNGISISKSVYDLVVPKTKMTFNDLGVQKVKQNEFHAFDILLDPSQKRKLKTKSIYMLPIIGAVAAALVLMVGVFYFNETPDDKADRNFQVLSRTLLILPFENNSPKEFNYIASGITDHLRSTLPSTTLLNVVPRQKSEQIKNDKLSIENLKNDVGISYILSGRVSVAKDKFRVSLELLDIHKGEILSASNSEYLVEKLFSAQDEIEFNFRKELQVKLTMGSVLSSKLAENFKDKSDYNNILKLRVEENKINPEKTYQEIENDYKKILENNPGNSQASFLFAKAIHNVIAFGETKNRKKDAKRLNEFLANAIQKYPQSSALNAFHAFTREFYWGVLFGGSRDEIVRGKNEALAKKAITIDPENFDTLYWTSRFYATIGKAKLAAPLIEKAISIAPFGPKELRAFRCRVYIGGFEFEKAEEVAREIISLADQDSVFLGSMLVAFIQVKTNRLAEARATFKKILDQEKISAAEVIAKFRKYTGYDDYFNYEKNTLESLAPNLS